MPLGIPIAGLCSLVHGLHVTRSTVNLFRSPQRRPVRLASVVAAGPVFAAVLPCRNVNRLPLRDRTQERKSPFDCAPCLQAVPGVPRNMEVSPHGTHEKGLMLYQCLQANGDEVWRMI